MPWSGRRGMTPSFNPRLATQGLLTRTGSSHEQLRSHRSVCLRNIYTQGNGLIPTGKFVTQDGVHVYREWSVVRQDLSPATLTRTDYKRATAAETLSQTKAEKARLALALTVVKAY